MEVMERCWVTKEKGRNGTYMIQARLGDTGMWAPKGVTSKRPKNKPESERWRVRVGSLLEGGISCVKSLRQGRIGVLGVKPRSR